MINYAIWFSKTFKTCASNSSDDDQTAKSLRLSTGLSSKLSSTPCRHKQDTDIITLKEGPEDTVKVYDLKIPKLHICTSGPLALRKYHPNCFFLSSRARYIRYKKIDTELKPGPAMFMIFVALNIFDFLPNCLIIHSRVILSIKRKCVILCSRPNLTEKHLEEFFDTPEQYLPVARLFEGSTKPNVCFTHKEILDKIKLDATKQKLMVITPFHKFQNYNPSKVRVVLNGYKKNAYLICSTKSYPPVAKRTIKVASQFVLTSNTFKYSYTVNAEDSIYVQLAQREAKKYFSVINLFNEKFQKQYDNSLKNCVIDFVKVNGKIVLENVVDYSFAKDNFELITRNESTFLVLKRIPPAVNLSKKLPVVHQMTKICSRFSCTKLVVGSKNLMSNETVCLYNTVKKYPNSSGCSIRQMVQSKLETAKNSALNSKKPVCKECKAILSNFYEKFVDKENLDSLTKAKRDKAATKACLKLYKDYKKKLIEDKLQALSLFCEPSLREKKQRRKKISNSRVLQQVKRKQVPLLNVAESKRYQIVTGLLAEESHSSLSSNFTSSSIETEEEGCCRDSSDENPTETTKMLDINSAPTSNETQLVA